MRRKTRGGRIGPPLCGLLAHGSFSGAEFLRVDGGFAGWVVYAAVEGAAVASPGAADHLVSAVGTAHGCGSGVDFRVDLRDCGLRGGCGARSTGSDQASAGGYDAEPDPVKYRDELQSSLRINTISFCAVGGSQNVVKPSQRAAVQCRADSKQITGGDERAV